MFTVDASVWVNAFDQREHGHQTSRRFLEVVHAQALPVVVPTLLTVEVAGAISRTRGEPERALEFVSALTRLPNVTLIPLDENLAPQAEDLAAQHGLRGADAVYAAAALHSDCILVSLDREHLTRLAAALPACTPAAALAEMEAAEAQEAAPSPPADRIRSSVRRVTGTNNEEATESQESPEPASGDPATESESALSEASEPAPTVDS